MSVRAGRGAHLVTLRLVCSLVGRLMANGPLGMGCLFAQVSVPYQWGGPNIGGGMLQLLFYVGVIVGAVLTVLGVVRLRNNHES